MKGICIMPYKTFWYEENKVIFTEVIGNFTFEELQNCNQEFLDNYFESNENNGQPIHLIVDLRSMTDFPKKLGSVRDASRKTANFSQLGWLILIGVDNPLLKFLSTTILQLVRINCKIVQTLEEAEITLERVRFAEAASQNQHLKSR